MYKSFEENEEIANDVNNLLFECFSFIKSVGFDGKVECFGEIRIKISL